MSNLKQNKASSQCIYGIIYIFCMSICTNHIWDDQFAWRNVMVENALFLPMIFSYCSASVHSIQLEKMMDLCPMDLCIVVCLSNCDIFSAIQILLNHMLVAVMISHGQRTDDKRRRKVIIIGEVLFVTSLLSNAIQFGIIVLAQHALWVKLVLYFIFCSVQLPLEIWYVQYIRRALRVAVFFETDLGAVEK